VSKSNTSVVINGAAGGIEPGRAEASGNEGCDSVATRLSAERSQAAARNSSAVGRFLALIASCLLCSTAVAAGGPEKAAAADPGVKLYTLDCGHMEFKDMGIFADTGEYDGSAGKLTASCFVIRHPNGTLLWDSGLGDRIAGTPQGIDLFGGQIHFSVPLTVASQLEQIGLAPADITYVSFSHLHLDHAGNANMFASSTWILNSNEIAWATATPAPFGVDPSLFSGYKTAKTQMIDGDYDVFGDGTVRILKAPGHTPGHSVLELKLKKAGVVILSGDLYHLHENRTFARVPTFNHDRADTLASIDRIEKIARNTKALFVVQHDAADLKTLPKFPAYLE
jgi:glyoxylase-like metal-dependent hydrolase (beta-lactamase superfamily II)